MIWWLIPTSYFLGSISFSVLLVSLLEHQDIRGLGSGNAGATNVLRVSGKPAAVATLILDVGKGALPIWIGLRLGAPGEILAASALAVVVGHVYPVYHGFRGGKGVATAAGSLAALEPSALTLSLTLFVVVVVTTRYVSLASIIGISTYPIAVAGLITLDREVPGGWWLLAASSVIAALVVLRHGSNLTRLLDGSERRLGERKEAL